MSMIIYQNIKIFRYRVKHYVTVTCALILLAGVGLPVAATPSISPLPASVKAAWKQIEMTGQAKFSRFGLHIYDASLWRLFTKTDDASTKATALSITYARNISARRLVSSTRKEWQRLGFAQRYPIRAWLSSLEKIWPDVKPGDNLTAVISAQGDCIFYSHQGRLGSIDDSDFGPAFLDIWLSPEARYPKHTKELLGET